MGRVHLGMADVKNEALLAAISGEGEKIRRSREEGSAPILAGSYGYLS